MEKKKLDSSDFDHDISEAVDTLGFSSGLKFFFFF